MACMKNIYKALLLAVAIVLSFWVSFIFGGKQAQFNDWHYDYKVLSYGLNRPEKHDNLGYVPQQFIASGGYGRGKQLKPDEMAYR